MNLGRLLSFSWVFSFAICSAAHCSPGSCLGLFKFPRLLPEIAGAGGRKQKRQPLLNISKFIYTVLLLLLNRSHRLSRIAHRAFFLARENALSRFLVILLIRADAKRETLKACELRAKGDKNKNSSKCSSSTVQRVALLSFRRYKANCHGHLFFEH